MKRFIQEGARVITVGRNHQTLDAAARELGTNVLALRAGVSELPELDNLYSQVKEKFGRVDILFANAGIAGCMPLEQVSEEFFGTTFSINTMGVFFTVQKALPLPSKGTSVILTTTGVVEKGRPGMSVYAASKAAIRSLARSMSAELVDRGIRVNVLSPGPAETPIVGKRGLTPEQTKAMQDQIMNMVPMGRMAHANELANVALFLASDESSFMLGSDAAVGNGMAQL